MTPFRIFEKKKEGNNGDSTSLEVRSIGIHQNDCFLFLGFLFFLIFEIYARNLFKTSAYILGLSLLLFSFARTHTFYHSKIKLDKENNNKKKNSNK